MLHSALKNLSIGMAVFMLFGQQAFFRLHIHLDKISHKGNTTISHSIHKAKEKLSDRAVLVEYKDHKTCDLCDMFLSKKLDLTQAFKFAVYKSYYTFTEKSVLQFISSKNYSFYLRGPPQPRC
ncbi:hypothetical protein [Chondrinema litorale]|uniref:hypothetical protein n=1 Tax=Chondrinema litorale TaxID=2994555 RepID=UPI002543726E|nr:hypothetical protein [Chondrinema litorale]UZR94332.1 hypothetical protein OQ292_00690 [Chondrinema litorale]